MNLITVVNLRTAQELTKLIACLAIVILVFPISVSATTDAPNKISVELQNLEEKVSGENNPPEDDSKDIVRVLFLCESTKHSAINPCWVSSADINSVHFRTFIRGPPVLNV